MKETLGFSYDSACQAAITIIRKDGVRGLYKGLWPNLCKVRARSLSRKR